MKIKEVCRRTGLTERTVRFWAEQGLIQPQTYELNQRVYFNFTEADIHRLDTVSTLRRAGFSVSQILVMERNPAVIGDTVAALRAELTVQKEESARSAAALQGAESCGSLPDLADRLRDYAEERVLPEANPRFGRFDGVDPAEKRRAYGAFLENSQRRRQRRLFWTRLLAALGLMLCSIFGTLLATDQLPGRTPAPTLDWQDRLTQVSDDHLVFYFVFPDDAYPTEPAYVGLDGATGRMTRVYQLKQGQLAFQWRRLSGTEAELLTALEGEFAPLGKARWTLDPTQGETVLVSYVPAEDETGGYYQLYAIGQGLSLAEIKAALVTVRANLRTEPQSNRYIVFTVDQ